MKSYIDENGVENVAVGIIKQARKDFIKGAKRLYKILHYIPEEKELLADQRHCTLLNSADVRWMYNAWRFVINDPYRFFGDVEEKTIIKSWKNEAILNHYREIYILGAAILYKNHSRKSVQKIDDEEVIRVIDNTKISSDFISARNYVASLDNADKIFREWNINAFGRVRKGVKIGEKSKIQNSEFHKNAMEKRAKNVRTAKELTEAGMSVKAIAKYLGVQEPTVKAYLRS